MPSTTREDRLLLAAEFVRRAEARSKDLVVAVGMGGHGALERRLDRRALRRSHALAGGLYAAANGALKPLGRGGAWQGLA